jgi:hypothetical protein
MADLPTPPGWQPHPAPPPARANPGASFIGLFVRHTIVPRQKFANAWSCLSVDQGGASCTGCSALCVTLRPAIVQAVWCQPDPRNGPAHAHGLDDAIEAYAYLYAIVSRDCRVDRSIRHGIRTAHLRWVNDSVRHVRHAARAVRNLHGQMRERRLTTPQVHRCHGSRNSFIAGIPLYSN